MAARRDNPAQVISFQEEKNRRAHEERQARGTLSRKFDVALAAMGYPKASNGTKRDQQRFWRQWKRLHEEIVVSLVEKLSAIRRHNPGNVVDLARYRAVLALAREAKLVAAIFAGIVEKAGWDLGDPQVDDLVKLHAVSVASGRKQGFW